MSAQLSEAVLGQELASILAGLNSVGAAQSCLCAMHKTSAQFLFLSFRPIAPDQRKDANVSLAEVYVHLIMTR